MCRARARLSFLRTKASPCSFSMRSPQGGSQRREAGPDPAMIRPRLLKKEAAPLAGVTYDVFARPCSGLRLLAIDHPGRPELIDQHAEALRPEGLPDRHLHR